MPPDSSFDFLGVQSEMDSLLSVLAAALAQADTTTIEYAQAKFDYDFVVADGSRGIHNAIYARALLISSIQGLPPVGVKPSRGKLLKSFQFLPPYPNPFNPIAALSYELQAASLVKLQVFDLSGSMVATIDDGWREAGVHETAFDGSNLPSGIYICRIQANEFIASGKMVLLK